MLSEPPFGLMCATHSIELAERESSAALVRLLWCQGTRRVWVEVREPGLEQAFAIPVPAERALDAFHHPYAYAYVHDRPEVDSHVR